MNWYDCFVATFFAGAITYCTWVWGWQGFLYSAVSSLVGAFWGYIIEPFMPTWVGLKTSVAHWRHEYIKIGAMVCCLSVTIALVYAYVSGARTELRSPPITWHK
jgi:hypothetical protein